jgi:hypothetical protein
MEIVSWRLRGVMVRAPARGASAVLRAVSVRPERTALFEGRPGAGADFWED